MIAEPIEFIFVQAGEEGLSKTLMKLEVENFEAQSQSSLDLLARSGKPHLVMAFDRPAARALQRYRERGRVHS
jgi:hypothetical protein